MDISPDKQNIDSVFANTTYYIDFYQRDYRWTEEPVNRLLDDIFFKFREQYERSKDLDPSREAVTAHYPWYYLNTYVTNEVEGRTYVVDGQQRLTTLTLILIKLYQMALRHESRLTGWLQNKISGFSGYEREFWMNHVAHKPALAGLVEGREPRQVDTTTGITAQNMVRNFTAISNWLDRELLDRHMFETFAFYFLYRLVLINLSVAQTDVPMVFEVINDRGVRLKPHEILKGKLLGQIDKSELDRDGYNALWDRQASKVNAYGEDELDEFFRFYLRAKYASTSNEGKRFDGDYHRAMFTNDMEERLGLSHSPVRVKSFLKNEFSYYSDLYTKLLKAAKDPNSRFPCVYYSDLLQLDAPFLLGLSVCNLNDPEESAKIEKISEEIDRYFSLLQLQNAYDSNDFADSLFRISHTVRGANIDSFRPAFDAELTQAIATRRNVDQAEPLSYSSFRQTGINLNMRFKRYFFARIDDFLAKQVKMSPKHPLGDLVTKTGAVTGFHVEHILSYNQENIALFDGDEERFEQERNRLGGILLLKGRDNISSSNESYNDKLRSYAGTLYWNETLLEDTYKSKLDLDDFIKQYNLDLRPITQFGPEELESRHRLLFELVRLVWG